MDWKKRCVHNFIMIFRTLLYKILNWVKLLDFKNFCILLNVCEKFFDFLNKKFFVDCKYSNQLAINPIIARELAKLRNDDLYITEVK